MINSNDNIKPPVIQIGIAGWLRKNLFSNWYNGLFTILAIAFLIWFIPSKIQWLFFDAIWSGDSKSDCKVEGAGACWIFISANLKLIFYGLYPTEELWRINSMYFVLLVSGTYLLIPNLSPIALSNAWPNVIPISSTV